VFGLLGLAFAGFVVLVAIGAVLGLVALVFQVVLLPFRLLGFVFKLIGAVLFLPLLLLVGFVVLAFVGLPLFFMAIVPLLPIALLALGIWWLVKRGAHPASPPHSSLS
jgi:hypothetical protein